MPKGKRSREDQQTNIESVPRKKPRPEVSDESSSRTRRMTVSDFNRIVRCSKIPSTPGKSKSARSITEEAVRQSLMARDSVTTSSLINKAFCDSCAIEYVTEAIAQIIVAKNIRKIDIPTPFGECTLSCLGINNYIARVISNPPKYQVLLDAINGFEEKDKLINEIQKFLSYEIDDRFNIDTTKDVSESIKSTLRNYIKSASIPNIKKFITYPKGYKGKQTKITYENVGAVMCGIFIAEIIRSAGKIVRATFLHSEWPTSITELMKIFIQANPGGCKRFREYVQKSSQRTEDIGAGEANAGKISPIKPRKK